MRNLSRITNAANRHAAWQDWHKIADEANRIGLESLVTQCQPQKTDGWRKIDRQTALLREFINQKKQPDKE